MNRGALAQKRLRITILGDGPCRFFMLFHTIQIRKQNLSSHACFFLGTWTMKYSQKLQPGWVRFSLSVRMSSSKRPRFFVKDMRRRVRSLSSNEFQDSWDRDESFRGSDSTTHLQQRTLILIYSQAGQSPQMGTDYVACCDMKRAYFFTVTPVLLKLHNSLFCLMKEDILILDYWSNYFNRRKLKPDIFLALFVW